MQNGNGKGPFVETRDGVNLYYKDWGKGQVVLFVHSWAANSDLWQYQMNDLCNARLRCVAYDRRGHGRSGQPWDGYNYDTLAADLHEVIETLHLHQIMLVGHSMACGEIIRYLTKYGAKRVSKIVLSSPTLPFALKTGDNADGVDKSVFERARAALAADVPEYLRIGAPNFFGTESKASAELMKWAIEMCHLTSLRAMLECNRAATETDFRLELKSVSVPTLIIHGDQDVSAPVETTAKRCAQLIPRAKLKIYEGAPHGIILTHKEELARDLVEFVSGSTSPAQPR